MSFSTIAQKRQSLVDSALQIETIKKQLQCIQSPKSSCVSSPKSSVFRSCSPSKLLKQVLSPAVWKDDDFYATVESISPKAAPSPKGRCWACWEHQEQETDPLIRACGGCKDRDLQWIHQSCINRFANASHSINDEDKQSKHSSVTKCSRCNHQYDISYHQINPIVVMWQERSLRYALLAMTIGLITTTLLFFHVGLLGNFAVLFGLSFCYTVNFRVLHQAFTHSSGHYFKFVHGIGN